MFILYNTQRDATDPRDAFLATLATDIKKDLLTTGLPYRTDNKGGRCMVLPGHYNSLIYNTLGKFKYTTLPDTNHAPIVISHLRHFLEAETSSKHLLISKAPRPCIKEINHSY